MPQGEWLFCCSKCRSACSSVAGFWLLCRCQPKRMPLSFRARCVIPSLEMRCIPGYDGAPTIAQGSWYNLAALLSLSSLLWQQHGSLHRSHVKQQSTQPCLHHILYHAQAQYSMRPESGLAQHWVSEHILMCMVAQTASIGLSGRAFT